MDILKQLQILIGVEAQVSTVASNRIMVTTDINKIRSIADLLKNYGFDHVKSVTATDYPGKNEIEISYILSSYSDFKLSQILLILKTSIDRNKSKAPSLCDIWSSVEFLERETYDLMGVFFEGHPSNTPLLLPEDYQGARPLRKEFKLPKVEG